MFSRLKLYYQSLNRIYFLLFFTGVLTGLLVYFYSEDTYEKRIFESLALDVRKSENSVFSTQKDSLLLLNSLHIIHNTLVNRQGLFTDIGGLKAGVFSPVTVDLMTAQGACGSYSMVMARLLDELKLETRIIQMKVGDLYGGHIVLEAKNNDRWIVFDPLYNLYFKRPDGALASFEEISNDWIFYKAQVPVGYDQNYRYEGKQYTNWNKIPVLMPAIKKVLDWILGKENADTLSLRILVLRKFHVFFIITLVIQLLLISYMIYYIYRRQKPSVSNRKATEKETSKVTVKVVNAEKSIDHVDN